jgi:NSS family neurotransmitter:Na+ symporter
MSKPRAQFATRIGVIAASVGSAIGLGNIWRFPYEAGQHGGGAFLLIYILFVFAIGVPIICSEFLIGRSSHSNVLGAFQKLERKGSKWHLISYVGILSSLMILSFYSVVAGWTLEYTIQSVAGGLKDSSPDYLANYFQEFTTQSNRSLMWTIVFLLLNYLIIRKGLKNGIERMSNIMTPLLFVILLVFCVNSLMMPGAADGLKFLFVPDFSKITPKVMLGALGQAFFSLSLGVSTLITYASYFKKDVPLVRSASIVAGLDTLFAIVAGLIIFPALFTYGIEPTEGPKLVFEVLPYIFSQTPGGQIWATAFFFLLFLASITSTISMSEISISFFCEEWKMTREKASMLNTVIAIVFGSLCALSFGAAADWKIFGMTVFDLFNFTTANLLMPVCGIVFAIFAGWFMDKKLVRSQLTNDETLKVRTYKSIVFSLRYIAPLAILSIFLYQLLG